MTPVIRPPYAGKCRMQKTNKEAHQGTRLIRLLFIILVTSVFFLGLVRIPRAGLQENPKDKSNSSNRAPDKVTRANRDDTNKVVRVVVRNAAEREAARKMGTLVEDYGSFVVIAQASDVDLSSSELEISLLDSTVNLPGKTFDPIQETPGEGGKTDAGTFQSPKFRGGKDYYIVQFVAPVRDEWLDAIRAFGAEVLQFVPYQAFFVYGDGATMQRVAGQSRVRWVGPYLAEEKVAPELREQIAAQINGSPSSGRMQSLEVHANGTATFDVAIFARASIDKTMAEVNNIFAGSVKQTIKLPHNFFNVLRVDLPLEMVAQVAEIPDVVRIDPYFTPLAEDERAALIVAGNYTSTTTITAPGYNPLSQFGVNGQGVSVSVVDDGVGIPGDGGFYVTASNTVNGPLRGASTGASGHGHLNATIIAGNMPFSVLDPTGYNYGLGVAPGANIVNIPFLVSPYSGTEVNTIDDTINTAGPNGSNCFITNNSWGNGTNSNSYDSYAAQYDGYVQDGSLAATIDPILIVFSAGNSGTSGLTRPKVAKNVIAVANSENLRTELSSSADNIDDLNSTSSRGPAADGRIKPDITAPGTAIAGGRSGTSTLFGNIDTFHRWSTGTSHAAPQVAGAAALFTQFWKNANGGSNPSPALVKAAILNTGQEMTGVGTNTSTIPNGNEGWGRINLKFMLNPGVPVTYVNQSFAFSNPGEAVGMIGKVSSSTKPVRITLVWTDPPGIGNPALVNNLDLFVNVGGTIYKGNVFSGGTSTSGGSYDTLNNVENVFLPAGIPSGTFIAVSVSSVAINGDGILGNADTTDQHFAIVAYNFSFSNQPTPSDFDGDSKSDIAVFRSSDGTWYISQSSNGAFRAQPFGLSSDRIVPADFDGDRKTDIAVFRPDSNTWYILESINNTFRAQQFGASADVPVPADYDRDGKADVAVF